MAGDSGAARRLLESAGHICLFLHDPGQLIQFSVALQARDMTVQVAPTEQALLDAIQRLPPDAVLADWNDGRWAHSIARLHHRLVDAPLYLFARQSPAASELRQVFATGATRVFCRPYDPDDVVLSLDADLTARRYRRSHRMADLSRRERQVLDFIINGYATDVMATGLDAGDQH